MPLEKLSRLNLTLLVHLQILLEEQNVTKAAERLNLTQSAVSKYLAQLRDLFDDQLLTRTPKGLQPTPKALQLQRQLPPLLEQLEQLIFPSHFNPESCDRHFKVALPKITDQLLFRRTLGETLKAAPNLRLNLRQSTSEDIQKVRSGNLDLLIMPYPDTLAPMDLPDLVCSDLGAEELKCLVRADHPILEKDWSLETFRSLEHIGLGSTERINTVFNSLMESKGIKRVIKIAVKDFHSATKVCESTDLTLITSESWANFAASRYNIAALSLPLNAGKVRFLMIWHKSLTNDPAHKWFRQSLFPHLVDGGAR